MSSKRVGRRLILLGLVGLAPCLSAQTVSNVRARQLADGKVEVLYDLAGTTGAGAVVTVAFSPDGGGAFGIVPAASALSGHVGDGIAAGADRRVVWNAAATLPPETYGTSYRASVTATNPPPPMEELTVVLPGNVPLVMVRIPAGTFRMGAPEEERGRYQDDGPVHDVTLTSDYWIGKYEVTQAQWTAVMGTNPSASTACGGDCPVDSVSWNDLRGSQGFIAKLNEKLGTTKFRLPTEAEWERAARAGTATRFSFGDALAGGDDCAANAEADPFVSWCWNGGGRNRAVGAKGANPWGLHDMHGHVLEWVEDRFGPYTSTPQTNPKGADSGPYRVMRGGSRMGVLQQARSGSRSYFLPTNAVLILGFRLARDL